MLRIIVRTDDAGMAANVGGSVEVSHRIFEIDAPELEIFLREPKDHSWSYCHRQVIGVEVQLKQETYNSVMAREHGPDLNRER